MTSLRLPLVLALLALLPAATCGSALQLPPRMTRTTIVPVELPADCTRLELNLHEGLVTIEPGATLACEVRVHVVADDEAQLERLATLAQPTQQRRAGTVRTQVTLPDGAPLEGIRTIWRVQAPKGTTVYVATRKAAVIARGPACDLEVDGGSGIVEAEMNGGAAHLTTTSGSLILRGEYELATLTSQLGRIDLQLPSCEQRGVDVQIVSKRGDVWIDLARRQLFDFLYFGDERQVRCDPDIRLQTSYIEPIDGVDYRRGLLGDLAGRTCGLLRLDADGPVRIRLQPEQPVPPAAR